MCVYIYIYIYIYTYSVSAAAAFTVCRAPSGGLLLIARPTRRLRADYFACFRSVSHIIRITSPVHAASRRQPGPQAPSGGTKRRWILPCSRLTFKWEFPRDAAEPRGDGAQPRGPGSRPLVGRRWCWQWSSLAVARSRRIYKYNIIR